MSTTASVIMYNQQNLGDCFLIKFSNGDKKSWVMIDFGSYQGNNTIQEKIIANHIVSELNGDPLHIVLTHQHKDHLSGFITAADELSQLNVSQVWLSFLDDEDSEIGKAVRSVSTKYWQKSDKIKKIVENNFNDGPVKDMLDAKQGYDLFAEGQSGGQAISNMLEWLTKTDKQKKPLFLSPGDVFDMPGMEGEVKVYVFGPPSDFNKLRSLDPKDGEDVNGLSALNELDKSGDFLLNALEGIDTGNAINNIGAGFPFAKKYTIPVGKTVTASGLNTENTYNQPGKEWRKIDADWLSDVGQLSLHMDNLTNNTSLVLAFELVKTGKVLLFVGDAQIGNWKSWFDVKFKDTDVKAEDLLRRTVLYKAGHHSSHNATYKPGLELMNEKELVIMVPLNQEISDKFKFLMGKPPMMEGYNRKAQGRMVRTDTIFQDATKLQNLKFPFANKIDDIKGLSIVPPMPPSPPQLYLKYEVG